MTPDLWIVSFIGAIFSAVANVFLYIVPGLVSSAWFPESELSVASAIAFGALGFGNAIGFIIPPLIVVGPQESYGRPDYPSDWSNSDKHPEAEAAVQEVQKQLFWLFLSQAIFQDELPTIYTGRVLLLHYKSSTTRSRISTVEESTINPK